VTTRRVTTRRAAPADALALGELARAAYAVYVERIGDEPAPMGADYAAICTAGIAWVAEADRQIVGFVVLKLQDDHLLLDNVAVDPARQGEGIGALLLELAETETRRTGQAEIRLYTNEAMAENLAYYARHGYQETHRGVQDGYRRVFFVKRLAGDPLRISVRAAGATDHDWIVATLTSSWGATRVVSQGRSHDAANLPALVAFDGDGLPIGVLTYLIEAGQLEVVSLDATRRFAGIGTALLARTLEVAGVAGCRRVWLVTSNDNLAALRFYQRRGLRLVTVHRGAVDEARRSKPSIPVVGEDGIEIHDEIELAIDVTPAGASSGQ
jgi:ribosomal protein S18 acetylase RimI-like enzyme